MTVADSTFPLCAKNSRNPSLVVESARPPTYSLDAIGFPRTLFRCRARPTNRKSRVLVGGEAGRFAADTKILHGPRRGATSEAWHWSVCDRRSGRRRLLDLRGVRHARILPTTGHHIGHRGRSPCPRAVPRVGPEVEGRDEQAQDQQRRNDPAEQHQTSHAFSMSSSTLSGCASTRKPPSSRATRSSRGVSGRTVTTSGTPGATYRTSIATSRGVGCSAVTSSTIRPTGASNSTHTPSPALCAKATPMPRCRQDSPSVRVVAQRRSITSTRSIAASFTEGLRSRPSHGEQAKCQTERARTERFLSITRPHAR